MGTPLASFLTRYRKDAGAISRALVVPVLLVDPFSVEGGGDENDTHQLKTVSAVNDAVWATGEPQVFELRKQKENAFPRGVTIGRTRNNDLVLDHGSVSRFHGWFEWMREEKHWRLVDAGSKNGTFIERVRLEAKHPSSLPPEVSLCFGRVQARFLSPEAFLALLARRATEASTSSR